LSRYFTEELDMLDEDLCNKKISPDEYARQRHELEIEWAQARDIAEWENQEAYFDEKKPEEEDL